MWHDIGSRESEGVACNERWVSKYVVLTSDAQDFQKSQFYEPKHAAHFAVTVPFLSCTSEASFSLVPKMSSGLSNDWRPSHALVDIVICCTDFRRSSRAIALQSLMRIPPLSGGPGYEINSHEISHVMKSMRAQSTAPN